MRDFLTGLRCFGRGRALLVRRTALLRCRRMLVAGLGLPAAVACLVPLLSIVVMPVAFAGGVLAALDVLGVAPGQPGTPGQQARPRRTASRPPEAASRT